MITTLIFDFGNVFINLDQKGALAEMQKVYNIDSLSKEMISTNLNYEKGLITTEEFIDYYLYTFGHINNIDVIESWNYIIGELPDYRRQFLRKLKREDKYKLILLSNTNHMHMEWINMNVREFNEFVNCFDRFYLSHELGMRKPDNAIFEHVVQQDHLNPGECLFVDDTYENVHSAQKLGFKTWHLDPRTDDVIDLFTKNQLLF